MVFFSESSRRVWLLAIRLRTLPLAVAAIVLGYGLTALQGEARFGVFLLALLTAVLLQILSNLANDYGDGVSGADNASRKGPQRMVNSGLISPSLMFRAVVLVAVLCGVSGLALLLLACWGNWVLFAAFLGFGFCCIVAALAYTMGKRPYGYRGFGDIMAGLFFGPVAVLGTAILCGLPIESPFFTLALLPALAAGLCSTAVLSVNNIRDIETDLAAGKRTVAVVLGLSRACSYHATLIAFAVIFWGTFWLLVQPVALFSLVLVLPLCRATWRILMRPDDPANLVQQLHATSLSTAILNIGMAGVCLFFSA